VQAINPCARCVVPSRDARTGEAMPGFQKRFAELRQEHLPAGTSTAPFNHFYRFTVNTRIAATQAGKIIRVGNPSWGPLKAAHGRGRLKPAATTVRGSQSG